LNPGGHVSTTLFYQVDATWKSVSEVAHPIGSGS